MDAKEFEDELRATKRMGAHVMKAIEEKYPGVIEYPSVIAFAAGILRLIGKEIPMLARMRPLRQRHQEGPAGTRKFVEPNTPVEAVATAIEDHLAWNEQLHASSPYRDRMPASCDWRFVQLLEEAKRQLEVIALTRSPETTTDRPNSTDNTEAPGA